VRLEKVQKETVSPFAEDATIGHTVNAKDHLENLQKKAGIGLKHGKKQNLMKKETTKMIDVISLGAGVQSSTLLLMADRGEIKIDGEVVIPKYAIVADTGNEPKKVYEWIEFIKTQVKNIKIIESKKSDLVDDILNGIANDGKVPSVPFYTIKKDPVFKYNEPFGYETKKGKLMRHCTMDYKIRVVRREIRKQLGYTQHSYIPENTVRLWMGISTDEVLRAKESQVKYIKNVFPLLDMEMSRNDCLNWFTNNNLPLPPKSACIICPFHSNEHWRDMKKNDPESWNMAVEFDKKIRKLPKLDADIYLHRQCVPLDEAFLGVEQISMFDEECEGMCGL
jgi:hypothetical protein